MLKLFTFVLSVCLISVCSYAVNASRGLQIHIFDVGQGMSQLLVYPSGFTILLDAAELNWNSGQTAALIANKISNILGGKRDIDIAVATHLHLDHIGYAEYGGIWALVEKHGFNIKKLIDRDSGVWIDKNGDGDCTEDEISWHNVGSTSSTAWHWLCYATDPSSKLYNKRETPKICSTTQIKAPDSGSRVTIIAADGYGVKMQDGRPVPGNHLTEDDPPSENDYSIGMLFEYGRFSYIMMGDLDGEYTKSSYGYAYDDIETSVIPRLGEVDVYNVDHHGSSHSSNKGFMQHIRPSVSIASLGDGNTYGHPSQVAVDNILGVESDLYLTERGDTSTDIKNSVVTNSDILVDVSQDGSEYNIITKNGSYSRNYKSKGTSHPKCFP